MERSPEPELMEDPAQAVAYASADFSRPHQAFIDEVVVPARPPGAEGPARILDLGCGAADITVRLARAFPTAIVVGVDASPAMLAEGRRLLERVPEVAARIELRELHLPSEALEGEPVDLVVSNSLLHHLTDPAVLWSTIADVTSTGAVVAVMDLRRPPDPATVEHLVATYAAGEADLLVRDFRASLHAAYQADEVRSQLDAADLDWLEVEERGDRHLVAVGRRPGTAGRGGTRHPG
jgi:trans-aconitate methyltransferase